MILIKYTRKEIFQSFLSKNIWNEEDRDFPDVEKIFFPLCFSMGASFIISRIFHEFFPGKLIFPISGI